jgi:DNA-binding NtrC family response regulator
MAARVRELTPVLPGEGLRLGSVYLEVTNRVVAAPTDTAGSFGDLVGDSPQMQRLFSTLERIARHDAIVLISGESGTGKELAARALHEAGLRWEGPFVAVNCASVPDDLSESELFGHEAGAFTGATEPRDGAFQRADGGTLFLDELGEMSLDVQAKLLRALESGEVSRVGSSAVSYPDVRVVAATNRDLRKMARAGTFRSDLLFRLSVLHVEMPPLREHGSDIGQLSRALLHRHHPGATLEDDAVIRLRQHSWPGNVRELRNVLTRAVVLCGERIRAEHLTFDGWSPMDDADDGDFTADELEQMQIRRVLTQANNNRSAAARMLGIPRTSLLYKMRKYGLG